VRLNLLFLSTFFFLPTDLSAQSTDSTQTSIPKKTENVISIDTSKGETEFQSTEAREKLPSWFYSVGFDGTASSGNVNRQLFNFKTTLNFENPKSPFGFFANPRFQYGTNSDLLQEREIFIDLNSTMFYSRHNIYPLIFGAYEQSNLRKINVRYNVGVGIGWKILGGINSLKSKVKLSISNAIVREATDFETKQDVDIYRNSTRIRFRQKWCVDKSFVGKVNIIKIMLYKKLVSPNCAFLL
jgi:hypothetical protein